MNPEPIKIWGIIPAAGMGRRMGADLPKQYLQIADKTILGHSINKLLGCELVAGVAVGIAENDEYWSSLYIDHARFLGSYSGGRERIHTVLNGLEFLQDHANGNDWILVHDAVRPCVEIEDIRRLIEKGLKNESGAILANKVVDTVKQINKQNEIQQTLDRNQLALAQTPQLFPLSVLKKALSLAVDNNQLSTDESAAVEALGLKPIVIEGSRTNIKITASEDLKLAELIINQSVGVT